MKKVESFINDSKIYKIIFGLLNPISLVFYFVSYVAFQKNFTNIFEACLFLGIATSLYLISDCLYEMKQNGE